jgi:glutamate synthase domain-containing protein 2
MGKEDSSSSSEGESNTIVMVEQDETASPPAIRYKARFPSADSSNTKKPSRFSPPMAVEPVTTKAMSLGAIVQGAKGTTWESAGPEMGLSASWTTSYQTGLVVSVCEKT